MVNLKRLGTMCLACACVAASGGLAAESAQAKEMSVKAALLSQQKLFMHSAAWKDVQEQISIKNPAQAKALAPRLGTLASILSHASTVVSNASASSSTQKQAQREIVTGLSREASGIRTLQSGVEQYGEGMKSTAKATLLRGEKTLKSADVIEQKGVKMLGGSTV
jgi:hypothetical protein